MTDKNDGVGIVSLLGLLFVGLKLSNVIDWSWWWVTAPFWGGFAVLAFLLLVWGGVILIQKIDYGVRNGVRKFKSKRKKA